jgi:hypothetical protein
VYIGETGRSVSTRLKEHERCVRLGHVSLSALAEHKHDTGHNILFEKSKIVARSTHFFPRKIHEAIEIHKHPNNMNKDSGYFLPQIWKHFLDRSSSLHPKYPEVLANQQRVCATASANPVPPSPYTLL